MQVSGLNDARATARFAPDPFTAACPSRTVLDRIGDKWTVLVISSLTDGPQRFGELARRIDGVSQKMLTQTLRGLERDGLVTRTIYAEVPPRVDYELTDRGRTLIAPLQALISWAEKHVPDIERDRAAYDARG
ncbi:helix-turn-helix transcriptional regulator [Nocardioides sp. HDW12B]|uniref:winged helix-turn-helix transcriptional regulator n=1 Tax=Nocardioides sp. HDW12B TaxID=2714939 RepID=UPI00140E0D42|nr:helix-turn-helix domain-containing protein [Nocardioides sp. HDW12B]QIK68636.1 helix-turn-helix transcriptional regulator [Nocardioides sp. HDW12B]